MPVVVVVGGGVTGLAAAYRLRRSLGASAEIVVVEQASTVGGKLCTTELAGCPYDVGAEAFLARRDEVLELAEELGVRTDVVHPAPVSAGVRAGGMTRPVPGGTVMGVPSSAEAVREVLSPAGLEAVRAEGERPPLRLGGADVAVGRMLRDRVGDEVVDRLVEPLLGGVYAGDADQLGLRATMPALAAALDAGAESVTAAAAAALPPPRQGPGSPGPQSPVFGAFRTGYQRLIDALVSASGAEVRVGLPVRELVLAEAGWRVRVGSAPGPETLHADAVVLAVPAPSTRRLLSDVAPVAAQRLEGVELASMVVVGMALPANVALPESSGVLIARGETRTDGVPFTAKAFTFSSRKWPHLRGVGGELLVRGSVGRFGEADQLRATDAELVRRVRADFAELTGIATDPVETTVTRWGGGLPQYGVGHLDTVEKLERAVAKLPGLAVAGAYLHGVGVPACVATANAAATRITRYLLAG